MLCPVPSEKARFGTIKDAGEFFQCQAVFGFEEETEAARFVEVLFFDQNVELIRKRPESAVEEPVGRFGEGEAVANGAGATVAEALDVGGIKDGGAVFRHHAVAGERAGEVVGGQDCEGKAGFPFTPEYCRRRFWQGIIGGLAGEIHAEQGRERGPGLSGEVMEHEGTTRGIAEGGIGEAKEVVWIEPGDACQVAGAGLATVFFVGCPKAVGAGVEKRELHIRPRSPAHRAQRPVGIETEGEFAIATEIPAGEFAAFEQVDDHEVKQGLVRRGSPGLVLFEVGQLRKPVVV